MQVMRGEALGQLLFAEDLLRPRFLYLLVFPRVEVVHEFALQCDGIQFDASGP